MTTALIAAAVFAAWLFTATAILVTIGRCIDAADDIELGR